MKKNELNFEIHMGEEINKKQDKIPFIIEKDIKFTDNTNTTYTIKAGVFQFNKKIGTYGGYSIK